MLRSSLGVAALAATLALPAAADAAVTIGTSPAAALPTSPLVGCAPAASCTLLQERLANESFIVPAVDGSTTSVVVAWRVYGQGGQVRLRRIGGTATATGQLPAAAGSREFAAQLPVEAGDQLAVDLLDGAQLSYEQSITDADLTQTWTPALGDGERRSAPPTSRAWLFYQAVIEPDRDGDGLGDETQDGCVFCDGPRDGDGRTDQRRTPTDPYASVRTSGPRVTIAAKATGSKKGVASLTLTNPYDFKLTGSVTARQGRRAAGRARVTLAPGATASVALRLAAPARRTLTSKRSLKLSVAATMSAPVGRARTTARAVSVRLATTARRPAPRAPSGGGRAGFDGTYRASDGQVMVVANGVVTTFNGDLTLYCTRAGKQKRVTYAMIGDDPDPKVAADGSFAWEATRGYGFQKLKFDGRISGDTASGRLMIEDRSPLLGTGRFEFDYCFAGKEWRLTR
jgi:hypothetical protein